LVCARCSISVNARVLYNKNKKKSRDMTGLPYSFLDFLS
jgi:hypothetical protein